MSIIVIFQQIERHGIVINVSQNLIVGIIGVICGFDSCPCSDSFPYIGQAGGFALDFSLYVSRTIIADILKAFIDVRTLFSSPATWSIDEVSICN